MTESSQVNAAIRRHLGPLGRWVRFESAVGAGWPDWYWAMRGHHGWVEAKLIPANGAPPPHFTLDQILWAEEETRAAGGGRWFLLGLRLHGREREWLAYGPAAARRWYEARAAVEPDLRASGAFPTRALVELLAPRATAKDIR